MAEGRRSGCEIVPGKDTSLFHLRVWLSSPEDIHPADDLFGDMKINVGGRNCTAYYIFAGSSDPTITLALTGPLDYALGGTAAKVSIRMVLLDKTGSPVTSVGRETASWEGYYAMIAAWDDVKANCLVDNYFVVLCSVHIDRKPQASSVKEELPDLGHDLAIMSDKEDLTDVSFHVGGESFSAHRLVLATRSPVFRAQLYGPMAESKMTSITVQDMEASTFRCMLHYIYHGSLSDVAVKDVCSTMPQYQHLLVAADRYGVEGLKKICEDKLSGNGITVDSVISMLELAEDHVCPKLKAACLDFLADGDNYKMVTISDEYIRLIQSFPNLLVEVRSRIKKTLEESTTINPGAHKKTRLR
ncbi:BTB/POZ and MATH domain-containing protein 1-like [Lolium rigidum]|uniref:BTB/POZ and MATH domain-containing protein 1-like n=1 Tax=Lolium rigidum TaxID=89674 RepID=UPI001F5DDD61|nr:BTB/POZ and MATH domain-containing protein 1-like [Lolium rigidum]